MTENNGGIKEGRFTEKYECVNCGAWGEISGEASAPAQEWNRYGNVFEGEY